MSLQALHQPTCDRLHAACSLVSLSNEGYASAICHDRSGSIVEVHGKGCTRATYRLRPKRMLTSDSHRYVDVQRAEG
jgi:hypothetical protein